MHRWSLYQKGHCMAGRKNVPQPGRTGAIADRTSQGTGKYKSGVFFTSGEAEDIVLWLLAPLQSKCDKSVMFVGVSLLERQRKFSAGI